MRTARPARSYSGAELAFISKNRRIPRKKLHMLFVNKFNRHDVTLSNLQDVIRRKRWQDTKNIISISDAELRFLTQYQYMKRRELLALFIDTFGRTDVTYNGIRWICRRYGLQTGRVGASRPIGWELLKKDGFVAIKISEIPGRSWHQNSVLKHRWLWEKENGPVPDGHKLKCLDGNRRNTDPLNWESVPNGLMSRLRARNFENAPAILKPTIMAVSRLEHALCEGKRR